jgi:hypothetical protein
MRLVAKFYPEDESDPTILPAANATIALSTEPADDTTPSLTVDQQLARLLAMVEDLQRRIAAMERILNTPPR